MHGHDVERTRASGKSCHDNSAALYESPNTGPSGSSSRPASSGPVSTASNPSRSRSCITAAPAARSSPAAAMARRSGAPRGAPALFELLVAQLVETLAGEQVAPQLAKAVRRHGEHDQV